MSEEGAELREGGREGGGREGEREEEGREGGRERESEGEREREGEREGRVRGRRYNLQWSAVPLFAVPFQSAMNTASGQDPGAGEHN